MQRTEYDHIDIYNVRRMWNERAAATPASLVSVQCDAQLRLLPRLGCAGEGAAFCRSSSSRRTQPVAELIVVWMCAGWSSGGCAYAGVPVRTGCGGVRVMGVRVCWRVGLGSRWFITFDRGTVPGTVELQQRTVSTVLYKEFPKVSSAASAHSV